MYSTCRPQSFRGRGLPARRFPPPWSVEELDAYLIVRNEETVIAALEGMQIWSGRHRHSITTSP
jgi:hypothetical protein